MSKPKNKIAVLVAGGVAALMISSMAGCKVEIQQSGDSGTNSGGSSSGGSASGGGSSSTSGGGNGKTGSGGNGKVTGKPGISLSRESVQLPCPGSGCAQSITIRSTGTAPLSVYGMSMLDDPNFTFGKACVNKDLHPGESCTFNVTWTGPTQDPSTYTARLVIHQNLPGGPTYIAMTRIYSDPVAH